MRTWALSALLLGAPAVAVAAEGTPGDPSEITNGQEAQPCQWPSAVALVGEFGDPFCTGTLVHPQLVITAAHCIASQTPVVMAFGEDAYAPAFTVPVDLCVDHPGYVPGVGNPTDLAVCQLSEAVNDVPLVPVLMGCEADALQPGAALTIVGFGNTVTSPSKGTFGSGPKRYVEQRVYAVREEVGEIDFVGDTFTEGGCHGDSGGPAFIQLDDGSWRVLGAAQSIFNPPEAQGAPGDNLCGRGTTYTLITPEMPWVEELAQTDLSPCFDAEGAWDPEPECTPFPNDIHEAVGTWAAGCGGGLGGAPQCGELPTPPGSESSGSDTSGESGDAETSGGSTSTTSGTTGSPTPTPPPEPEGTDEGTTDVAAPAADGDKGCGCGVTPGGPPALVWLALLFPLRRLTRRSR